MKCLILAAGKGSRLRSEAESKPLLPLLGLSLIERVIRSAQEAGADEFHVVVGHQREKVQAFLEDLASRQGLRISTIENAHWADRENGFSVLQARDRLAEPFLLLMADHVIEPALVRDLMALPLKNGEIALAIDSQVDNPLLDPEDVTRVRQESGCIQDLGKGLTPFDGLDTGVFHCSPAIFEALEHCSREGDTSLSGAIRRLAANGQAKAVDVSGRFWIDVDDPASLRRAERAMLGQQGGKQQDGPVSRWLNRPLSTRLSRILLKFPISPNQISLFSFALSLLAAGLIARGGYPALALGGVLAQVASIIDGCDGEVARLKYLRSDYGGWLDAVLDRYADAFLLFGLTWHAYTQNFAPIALGVGFLAIIGSFLVSYTADKYDKLMQNRVQKGLRVGRDVRVLLICLGALLNQPYAVLVMVAVLMNAETVRRLFVCRNNG